MLVLAVMVHMLKYAQMASRRPPRRAHLRAHGGEGVALYRGDFVAARAHLEQSLEPGVAPQPSTPSFAGGLPPRIVSLTWLLRALWGLGYADQAWQRSQEAVAVALQLEHAPSLVFAAYSATMVAQFRRDVVTTQATAEALMALAEAQGLGFRSEEGRCFRGWALALQGEADEGLAQFRQGLAAHHTSGPKVGKPIVVPCWPRRVARWGCQRRGSKCWRRP